MLPCRINSERARLVYLEVNGILSDNLNCSAPGICCFQSCSYREMHVSKLAFFSRQWTAFTLDFRQEVDRFAQQRTTVDSIQPRVTFAAVALRGREIFEFANSQSDLFIDGLDVFRMTASFGQLECN